MNPSAKKTSSCFIRFRTAELTPFVRRDNSRSGSRWTKAGLNERYLFPDETLDCRFLPHDRRDFRLKYRPSYDSLRGDTT